MSFMRKLGKAVGVIAAIVAVPVAFCVVGSLLFTFGMPIALLGGVAAALFVGAIGMACFDKDAPANNNSIKFQNSGNAPNKNRNSYTPKPAKQSYRPPYQQPQSPAPGWQKSADDARRQAWLRDEQQRKEEIRKQADREAARAAEARDQALCRTRMELTNK